MEHSLLPIPSGESSIMEDIAQLHMTPGLQQFGVADVKIAEAPDLLLSGSSGAQDSPALDRASTTAATAGPKQGSSGAAPSPGHKRKQRDDGLSQPFPESAAVRWRLQRSVCSILPLLQGDMNTKTTTSQNSA